jgi:hypothetical protein
MKLVKPWMTHWLVWKLSGYEKVEKLAQTGFMQILTEVWR